MTLVDASAQMLEVSRRLNADCIHVQGDMRTVRLGQTFDAVLVHDAIDYITSREDLRLVIETAFAHCRPGGLAVFAPDHTAETFRARRRGRRRRRRWLRPPGELPGAHVGSGPR